jgi:hypothetical protein
LRISTQATVSLRGSAIDPQAIVSMMLPSELLEVLEELELPPRFAIELSTNDEMIDCADAALVDDVVPDAVPEELEALAVRALIMFWNAVLRLEATLLEAPEPPSMLPSNALLLEAVARLVSAAAVEAAVGVELAAELEAPLVLAAVAAEVAAATAV